MADGCWNDNSIDDIFIFVNNKSNNFACLIYPWEFALKSHNN